MPIFNLGPSLSLAQKAKKETIPTLEGFGNVSIKLYLQAKKPYAIVTYALKSNPNQKSQMKIPLKSISFAGDASK